jgi:hypothetical protein
MKNPQNQVKSDATESTPTGKEMPFPAHTGDRIILCLIFYG